MPTVLFVCTANRSRSPVAAACLRKELASRGVGEDWWVISAGTWTTDGLPPVEVAILGAKRLGLDISGHASRVVTAERMQDADLVIVMERGQKEALENEFPQAAGKVHLLSEVARGSSYDIPDPLLSVLEGDGYDEIDELVHAGFDRICALVGRPRSRTDEPNGLVS